MRLQAMDLARSGAAPRAPMRVETACVSDFGESDERPHGVVEGGLPNPLETLDFQLRGTSSRASLCSGQGEAVSPKSHHGIPLSVLRAAHTETTSGTCDSAPSYRPARALSAIPRFGAVATDYMAG